MFTKKAVAVLGAVVMTLGVAACGSDGDDEKAEDAPVEDVVDDAAEKADEKADDDAEDESSSDETTGDDDADSDDGSSSDVSLGDMDLGDFEDCMSVSLTYASVYLALLGGDEAMEEAMADLEEIQTEVPDEIADDLDVILTGLSEADDFMEAGEFMETDEYIEADANVTEFLDAACG